MANSPPVSAPGHASSAESPKELPPATAHVGGGPGSVHPTVSPPALDGGWGWIVLIASVVNMVLTIGFVDGMGVLFVEWQEQFSVGPSEVGWFGIIGGAIVPVGCLLAGGLTSRFGHRLVVTLAGLVYCTLMLVATFTTQLWHLYVVFFFHALVTGATYQPSITVIGAYFQRWLALANGITYSGVGIGLTVIPVVLEALISRFTWRGALRILSAISLLTPICGLLFRRTAKEKYLMEQNRTQRKSREKVPILNFLGIDLLWQNCRFLLVAISCAVLGYGYYGSVVFIASKAVFEVGLTKLQGALLLSSIGVGSTISRAAHGLLIDYGLATPVALYCLGCFVNAATDFLHPFAGCFSSLEVLAVSFGLSSGLVFAVSIMCTRVVLREDQVSRGFGVVMLGNGAGTFIGVFAMAYLQEATGSYNVPFVVAGFAMVLAGLLMASVSLYTRCTLKAPPSEAHYGEEYRIHEIRDTTIGNGASSHEVEPLDHRNHGAKNSNDTMDGKDANSNSGAK